MDTPVKRCSKCFKIYPRSSEFFYRDKNGKDGLGWRCKSCLDRYCRAHKGFVAPHKRIKPKPPSPDGSKYCSKCEKHFPATLEYFGSRKRNRDGLNLWCIQCNREYTREHRRQNPDMYQESGQRYTKTPKGRIGQQVSVRRRRARKHALPDNFTTADWEHCLDYWNGRCVYCGQSAGLWHVIAADHFIPLVNPDCPGTVPSNIVPACHTLKNGEGGCNNSKQGRNPEIWLVEKFGKRKANQILYRIREYFVSLTR